MMNINKIKPGDVVGVRVVKVTPEGFVLIARGEMVFAALHPSCILPAPDQPHPISDLERAVIDTALANHADIVKPGWIVEELALPPVQRALFLACKALDKARNPPVATATDQAIAALAAQFVNDDGSPRFYELAQKRAREAFERDNRQPSDD